MLRTFLHLTLFLLLCTIAACTNDQSHTHAGDEAHEHSPETHTHDEPAVAADTAGTYADTTSTFFDGDDQDEDDHAHGPETHTHDSDSENN